MTWRAGPNIYWKNKIEILLASKSGPNIEWINVKKTEAKKISHYRPWDKLERSSQIFVPAPLFVLKNTIQQIGKHGIFSDFLPRIDMSPEDFVQIWKIASE
jgi:hypothetical protein